MIKQFTLTTSILLISIIGWGQNKKDTTAQQLTDTTKFISIADLLKFSDPYKDKYSARAWEFFQAIFNATIQDAIKEWNDKNKPKKP